MGLVRGVFIALALVVVFAFNATNISAKPEDTKKTGKTCTYCHVKMNSKELNDTGKYYKEHKELPPEKEQKKE